MEEEVRGRASHLLTAVIPHVIPKSKVEGVRQDLETKAEEAATSTWEALKEEAGNAAREKAEAEAAEAAEKAAEAGSPDGDAEEEGSGEPAGPAVDVEAIVAEAIDAVVKPDVKPVTDTDLLNALMEADAGLKDSIVSFMALQQLDGSWVHDSRFEDELEPKEE